MPYDIELLHFIADLMLAFSDVPVFLCLQQKDVTLSLRSVIVSFRYRVILSGCGALKSESNHKTWLCWPMHLARKLEMFLTSASP